MESPQGSNGTRQQEQSGPPSPVHAASKWMPPPSSVEEAAGKSPDGHLLGVCILSLVFVFSYYVLPLQLLN